MEKELILKSALKRVSMVKDWCGPGIACMPNVHADMKLCLKEIESVIYELQKEKINDHRK